MAAPEKRQFGVTNAISEAEPTPEDLKLNDELVDLLKRRNNFETPEAINNRKKVLSHLQRVVEEFVRRSCKAKGRSQTETDNAGGKIFEFGSYALGVYGPTSDIDTLVVAPKLVNMHDFFTFFPPTFREMSEAKQITEFNPVPEAFVPIIKMEYAGVSIDLLFVSLPGHSSVPTDIELGEKNLLRGLGDTEVRSLNGTRVTKEMLASVPQTKTFRYALRGVKLWSNQRAIYGAVFGFPGGVAWAIMVARICQLYPNACGATIVSKFFNLMYKWPWPRPVMLKSVEAAGTLPLRVWNPEVYNSDKAHIMPVITPAFPSMCSTHTVGHSTKTIMMEEFRRADEIVNAIHRKKKTWDDLFVKHTFFTQDHKYYLSVIAATYSKDDHDAFAGLVQSKVRILVKGIEDSEAVQIARPYIKPFERAHLFDTDEQRDQVLKGSSAFQVPKDSVEDGVAQGQQVLYTSTYYIGLTLSKDSTKSLDISYPVSDFRNIVTTFDSYKNDKMAVRVVHTRNTQLPDDVFEAGEVKPAKPQKEKKKKVSSKTANHKRPFAETGIDDSENAAKRRQPENATGLPTPTPA